MQNRQQNPNLNKITKQIFAPISQRILKRKDREISATIHLRGGLASLSTDLRDTALTAFAAILEIPVQQIRLYDIYEGSIVLELGIPQTSAKRLRALLQNNNAALHQMHIEKVVLQAENGTLEEWLTAEEQFRLVTPAYIFSSPENLALARTISLQATQTLAPAEAGISKELVDPLLEKIAKGKQLYQPAGKTTVTGFGSGELDLTLIIVVSIVTQIMVQLFIVLGKNYFKRPVQIVHTPSMKGTLVEVDRPKLREVLTTYFDEPELRNLSFDLHIEYDDLPGEGKSDKVRELITYCERRERTHELIDKIKSERPNAPWEMSNLSQSTTICRHNMAPYTRNKKEARKLAAAVNAAVNDAITKTLSDYTVE